MKAIALFLLILLSLSIPALAQEMERRTISGGYYEEKKLSPDDIGFFNDIKTAIETDNREWMANNVHYSLKVSLKEVKGWVDDKKQFLKYYDQIVTSKIKRVVARQKPEGLFKTYRGIMIGNGDIWIDMLGEADANGGPYTYYIVAIQDAPVDKNE